jgi:hypothetical protein
MNHELSTCCIRAVSLAGEPSACYGISENFTGALRYISRRNRIPLSESCAASLALNWISRIATDLGRAQSQGQADFASPSERDHRAVP